MNRFIQKTTSVILSLATVILIGAPAFAAYEPQEALNDTPAAAEAVAEPTEGKDKIEIEESGKEEAAQAQTVETASAAAEEEPTEEKSETETAVQEETPDETETEIGGSELPEISKEEIEEILRSDEVVNALEEAGIDGEAIIDAVENGDYEVVDEEEIKKVLTDEEIEEKRREEAKMPFWTLLGNAEGAIMALLFLPIAPIAIIVPVFGWVVAGAALISPILILSLPFQFVGACIESCYIYITFDPSQYK